MRLLEEYELKGQMERERERNQIVEIIAKSRRPIDPFEIKDVLDKIGIYENQFHRLFSESKMHDYMANEPALKPFMTGGDNFYRLVNSICTDLVIDRILELTENPDHGGREYSATTNLLRICHRFQE